MKYAVKYYHDSPKWLSCNILKRNIFPIQYSTQVHIKPRYINTSISNKLVYNIKKLSLPNSTYKSRNLEQENLNIIKSRGILNENFFLNGRRNICMSITGGDEAQRNIVIQNLNLNKVNLYPLIDKEISIALHEISSSIAEQIVLKQKGNIEPLGQNSLQLMNSSFLEKLLLRNNIQNSNLDQHSLFSEKFKYKNSKLAKEFDVLYSYPILRASSIYSDIYVLGDDIVRAKNYYVRNVLDELRALLEENEIEGRILWSHAGWNSYDLNRSSIQKKILILMASVSLSKKYINYIQTETNEKLIKLLKESADNIGIKNKLNKKRIHLVGYNSKTVETRLAHYLKNTKAEPALSGLYLILTDLYPWLATSEELIHSLAKGLISAEKSYSSEVIQAQSSDMPNKSDNKKSRLFPEHVYWHMRGAVQDCELMLFAQPLPYEKQFFQVIQTLTPGQKQRKTTVQELKNDLLEYGKPDENLLWQKRPDSDYESSWDVFKIALMNFENGFMSFYSDPEVAQVLKTIPKFFRPYALAKSIKLSVENHHQNKFVNGNYSIQSSPGRQIMMSYSDALEEKYPFVKFFANYYVKRILSLSNV